MDVAPPQASYHGHSAIYMQGLAGHVSRLLTRQIGHGRRNFIWLSKALHRDGGEDARTLLLVQRIGHSGFDHARRHAVQGDAATRHFLRRSEEHTSELQSLMRISYAVFCLKKQTHFDIL